MNTTFPDDWNILRERAQREDLRNRVISAGGHYEGLTPKCACGNLLTIEDRYSVCRECRRSR